LKRRNLWRAAPAYLGVYGRESWSEDDALEDLVASCWQFVFVDRLQALYNQLRVLDNIEGLVHRNIANFLYETQRRHDPLGFRMFQLLQAAVAVVVATGQLVVVSGSPELRNDTVLAFSPPVPHAAERRGAIAEIVAGWCNTLLPELVTADGTERAEVVAVLGRRLSNLAAQGIGSFGFADVLEPLKREVRARWASLWTEGEAPRGLDEDIDGPRVVPMSRADQREELEEVQHFRALVAHVERGIERHESPPRLRRYGLRLWRFLVEEAARGARVAESLESGRLPSLRSLGDALDIPRARLPVVLDLIREQVGLARQSIDEPRPTATRRMRPS
jgi:hypothetical protein